MPVIGESSDYLNTTSMNCMEVTNNYSSFLNVRGKSWSKDGFEFIKDMVGLQCYTQPFVIFHIYKNNTTHNCWC
jgi:hypothetical protein